MEWNVPVLAAFLAVVGLSCIEAQQRDAFRWSKWSDYSECSRSCGGGIQETVRRCESGRCQGRSLFYQSCNTQECPEHSLDFRTFQCRSFNSVRMEVKGITRKHSWRPHFDPSAPCALLCENEYGHVKKLRERVVDGTHCDNGKAFGLCIRGICKPVGCDHRLGFFANEDNCLQCGGSGDGCKTIRNSTMGRRLNSRKRTVVATIPEGVMTLKIKIMATAPSALELISEEGKRLSLTEATVSFGKHKVTKYVGTLFTFTTMRDTMEFFARGPTDQAMKLMVRYRGLSPLVEYEYSMIDDPRAIYGNEAQEERILEGRYRWIYGRWTTCSRECGPGYQLRAISCVDNMGTKADANLCPRAQMPSQNQTCNLGECATTVSAAYEWIRGHWGECSVECGTGEQTQTMHCLETGTSGKPVYVDNELCSRYAGHKPKYERVCQGEGEECGEWTTGSWSECSVSCGIGRQARKVLCQRTSNNPDAGPVSLADENCDEFDMPESEKLCNREACPDDTSGRPDPETTTQAPTTTKSPDDCSSSQFGCCPDGVTEATGTNNDGCPSEGKYQDLCQKTADSGSCRTFDIKWYYNDTKASCLRFWYGGCEGNDNRFDDKHSCINRCVKTSK